MSHAEYLAALSRLVTLFRNPAAGDDERLDAVRALVAMAHGGALEVEVRPAGRDVEGAASEAGAILDLLRAQHVRRLVIRRGTGARELAQFAGLLVRTAPGTAAGAMIQRGLDELRIWSVRLDPDGAGEDLLAALTPALRTAVGAVAAAETPDALAQSYAAVAAAFARVRAEAATESDAATQVARALAALLDACTPDGGAPAASHRDGFAGLLDTTLEAVVRAVAEGTVPEAWRVVRAAADRGVRLLINRLGDAGTIEERRRCFNAILDVGGSIDPLLEGLRDPRWYVVRNVALVLGELREPAAVRLLARALHGTDERVRQAAAQALTRIDAPAATHALVGALRDPSAAVRLLAARALQRAPEHLVPVSAALIASRLCLESDLGVAQELVEALRVLDTPEAYAALTALAAELDGAQSGPLGGATGAEALRALGRLPRPRLVQTLRGFTLGDDPLLRGAALRVARRLIPRVA